MDRRGVLLGALATGACGLAPRLPDVQTLYAYTSDIDPAFRRPIITIPGILGSRLRVGKDGPYVWGGPRMLSPDPNTREGASLVALPIGAGTEPLSSLSDGVGAEGVLRRAVASFLFASVEQQVYDGLVAALNAGGYEFSRTRAEEEARQGENPGSFEFPYDWRRDIVEAAIDLGEFVERKAEQVHRVRMQRYGRAPDPADIRFDFVAHSMGALVLRYYLMYGGRDLPADGAQPAVDWAGARRAACSIFVAPPNLGSITAFETLVTARAFGPLQPPAPPGVTGTFPSLYQLLPRARHMRVREGAPDGPPVGDIFDPAVWEKYGWGVLAEDQDPVLAMLMPDAPDTAARRARARAHLARVLARAEHFHRAMDVRGGPSGADLFLIVGTGYDTPAAAVANRRTGAVTVPVVEEGDGVVLRASALSDERQGGYAPAEGGKPIPYRTVLLLPSEHVSLTRNPVFTDNLLYWLLDTPRARMVRSG